MKKIKKENKEENVENKLFWEENAPKDTDADGKDGPKDIEYLTYVMK